jgi:hypothetical protein
MQENGGRTAATTAAAAAATTTTTIYLLHSTVNKKSFPITYVHIFKCWLGVVNCETDSQI